MKLLKQGPSDMVSLVVSRPKEDLMSLEENFETFNVDLNKRPGQNLGLTIIGKHRDSTVCIHELVGFKTAQKAVLLFFGGGFNLFFNSNMNDWDCRVMKEFTNLLGFTKADFLLLLLVVN